MIVCDSVSFKAGSMTLIDAISASIAPGRLTAILGANGAGKSTLLRLLAGLTGPSGGTATLDGGSIHAMSPAERARRIGYLPQATEVSWNMSVRELVSLGRLPHRSAFAAPTEADHHAVAAAMLATDTVNFADRGIITLSGGERARVLLARVIATQPDWILADEPLAHLDPPHRRDVMHLLKAQAQAGRGVVVVMHDLTLALRHADEVLVLKDGQLIAQDMNPDTLSTAFGLAFDRVETSSGPALIPSER
jgi:iron complex transport system ATP-binding protein